MNMKERLENEAYNQKQAAEMYSLLQKFEADYPVDITGDACVGDEVVFLRNVFGGSLRNPKFLRHEIVEGKIVNDSYGSQRGQHTFTLLTVNGEKTLIKGRNLYRNGLFAKPRNEEERSEALSEKHERGMDNFARKENRRDARMEYLTCSK
jgi:hypothetical protein